MKGTSRANATQVGGGHYKKFAIQPWDFFIANNVPYMEATIMKYLCRWREKNGVEDLKKARHFLDKLIEDTVKTSPMAAGATNIRTGVSVDFDASVEEDDVDDR